MSSQPLVRWDGIVTVACGVLFVVAHGLITTCQPVAGQATLAAVAPP